MSIKSTLFFALFTVCMAHDICLAGTNIGEAWVAATGQDGVQRVNIRCGPDFFDPRHIVVKRNAPVVLSVSTTQNLWAHSFVVGRLANSAAQAKDAPLTPTPTSIVFTPETVGDFPLVCQDDSGLTGVALQRAKQGVLTVIP